MRKISFTLFILTFFGFAAQGQGHSSKQSPPFSKHEIELFVGSTHVPQGSFDDSDATLIVPNIGINYKYWFDSNFAIGWYNNLVGLTYTVNHDSYQDLERKYPLTSTIVGIFKPWKSLSFFTGPGLETDTNKTLFVFRVGADYSFTLSNNWYFTPRFIFDGMAGEIQAYSLVFGLSKKF